MLSAFSLFSLKTFANGASGFTEMDFCWLEQVCDGL